MELENTLENTLENILEKNKEDKEYEFSWIVFKGSLLLLENTNINLLMDETSDKLNKTHKNNNFSDIPFIIKDFFVNNIENISRLSLISENANTTYKIYNSIRTFKKMLKEVNLFTDNFYFNLLQVTSTYIENNFNPYNKTKHYIKNICLIPNTSIKERNISLINLLNVALELKATILFDFIRNEIDFKDYLISKNISEPLLTKLISTSTTKIFNKKYITK